MDRRRLFSASFGHFAIDTLNASVAMIMVAVSGRFALSIADVGFGIMLYQISAGLSQPLFGGLTDRLRGRWVGPLGLLWTIIFYSVAALAPDYRTFIVLLTIGGLGSGAFHAAGMLNATLSGGDKTGTATSIFFVSGQTGLAIGPIVVGFYLPRIGLNGMPLMAALMISAVAVMLVFMNHPLPVAPKRVASAQTGPQRTLAATLVLVTAFILFILLRSGASEGLRTLLPIYFTRDLGLGTEAVGLMLGFLAFSGALGTLAGGILADRYDRKVLMLGATLLSVPFSFFMIRVEGFWFFPLAFFAGALLSLPHSILLVLAQELAPGRRGLVGGLGLGFIFASGSIAAWMLGMLADQIGLFTTLTIGALLPLGASAVALALPSGRKPEVLERSVTTPAQPTPAAAD
jgi:FSR family fosmidomycin resistance protein-like MFS transporter